jgi:hypothetical protein
MKIIGHTQDGYLVEIKPHEIASITGNPDNDSHQINSRYGCGKGTNHSIGTEFKVNEAWKHLKKINCTTVERSSIAERLRAAATLIEHTPTVMELPEPPATEITTDQASS